MAHALGGLGGRGGVGANLPDATLIVEVLTITSSAPVNFAPSSTHQITFQALNRTGAVLLPVTVSYATSNAAICTVDSAGLVTAVGAGTATITASMTIPAQQSTAISYVVTSPQNSPDHLTLSATTMAVDVGATATSPTASVQDASNQVLPGQTVTWSEVSGAGDVTLSADSGTDAHTTTVTGVTAGSRVIRATSGALTADVTVTVNAVTGATDTLGIVHPNLPSGFTPIVARMYGTAKPNGGSATRSVTYNPYYTGYTEGFDDAAEASVNIVTDSTVPFQSNRAVLYPGAGTRCALYGLRAGQPGNNTFAGSGTFDTTSTTRYAAGLGLNQAWRSLYWDCVFKFLPDFPALNLTKLGFVGTSQNANLMMCAVPCATSGSLTAPLTPLRLNLQGATDNALVAVPGDRAGAINATWSPAGASNTNQVTGGTSVTFTRGVWYRIEKLYYMNTHGSSNGSVKVWISSWDGTAWSTPIAAATSTGWTGLLLERVGATAQDQWSSIKPAFMNQVSFAGTGRFARSSNFDLASTVAVPYQIAGTNYSLPSGTVCDTGTTATLAAARWGAAMISANSAGVLTATWSTASGAGYASEGAAVTALGFQPPANQAEVGYLTVLAGAATWTAGTDALAGGTGGTVATTTNYNNRSGVLVAMDYWAMRTT